MSEDLEARADARAETPKPKIEIDPVDVVASFIETYELVIRPHLARGDVEASAVAIRDLGFRFNIVEAVEVKFPGKNSENAFYCYKMAVHYLVRLAEDAEEGGRFMLGEKFRRDYLNTIDRQVSLLDIAARGFGGERYEKLKKNLAEDLANRKAEK